VNAGARTAQRRGGEKGNHVEDQPNPRRSVWHLSEETGRWSAGGCADEKNWTKRKKKKKRRERGINLREVKIMPNLGGAIRYMETFIASQGKEKSGGGVR